MATVPVLPELPEPLEVSFEDVTTGTLNGTGIFDKLMQVAKVHLYEEFTKQRITSSDYAQVYLGTMNNVMDKAITYTLAKDKTALELQGLQIQNQLTALNRDLVIAQIAKVVEETDNLFNDNGFRA